MSDTLLDKIDTSVFKTDLTRKITLNGVTSVLPVYRIKLTELFYNDKNDRIVTSIDSYNRNHITPLVPGKNEEYNKVIENFIVKSNEQAIFKTKNNIRLVGQREAGVVLPDGRVIDGNRRFTCLRQLSSDAEKFNYFEAIILPQNADEKQIKLLELMIQHGEEQRVEYDPVNMIVGIYHDIKETEMITVKEYAKAIDTTEQNIENKLKMAEVFVDFLEFINMPKHWYVIKEFNIYAMTSGIGHGTSLESILRRCDERYRDDLKKIIYVNIILNTSGKLLEIISKLIKSDLITSYIRHTRKLAEDFKNQLDEPNAYSNFNELKMLISMNGDIKQEMCQLLDESFLKHKKNEIHSKPSKNISKAVTMIKSIDSNIIDRLTEKETAEFKQNLTKLAKYVDEYSDILDLPVNQNTNTITQKNEIDNMLSEGFTPDKTTYFINLDKLVSPICLTDCIINSLYKQIKFDTNSEFIAYFVDKSGNKLSNEYYVEEDNKIINFELNASTSSLKECWLIIKHPDSSENEVSQIICFTIKMNFVAKFDF